MDVSTVVELTYGERIKALVEAKRIETKEKQEVRGAMDHDDHAIILPPPEYREVVQTMSTSGMPITDVLIKGFTPEANHENGAFYGPKGCGRNFRLLLESHPTYIDPMSSLAGAYMVNFASYRKKGWNPDIPISEELRAEQRLYKLGTGIGASQHFCQDLEIGLELGWGGLLTKIRHYREVNAPKGADFYAGLEDVVLGMQNWIQRNAEAARQMAEQEQNPQRRENLEQMAAINARLVSEPPRTFREACQWMVWYQMAARMYNGSGSLGRLDVLLQPYYERDMALGTLTDDEATFHIACLLLRDTAYLQLGGPDAAGHDVTSKVSYLVLEAAHWLKIPANVGVCVGKDVDPGLTRRGVEIMFEDKAGMPKFLGVENIVSGFVRNGVPLEMARNRAYAGCHWFAIPGREYCMNDCIKINFGAVFEVAYQELVAESSATPSAEELFTRFGKHLRRAVQALAEGLDFHMEHMHEVFPELVLDLLCHGPIENGLDASQRGGVEYVNLGVDGAALATVADSFAAIEQRLDVEQRMSWQELDRYIASDWAGADGERARLMMKNISRYGSGGSRADRWAVRVVELFTELTKEKPTPNGANMIPGLFSWANTIPMGKELGATPNGRHAHAPISHGANPDPGFRTDGAPSAMAVAIASVQSHWGNSAPMQLELDPALAKDRGGVEKVADLIRGHMDLGGTQINLNIMDTAQVLEAHRDPSRYPDLVVRVTGFSAYFASLSPEFRQLVVDRIITEN
jgi:pyruvate-formate lyase